ncbi:protein phosphatase Slingshot homolog 3 isoform X2 [Hyperolius riggenbachi]
MQRRQSFVMVKGAALLLQDEDEPEENKEHPETPQTAGPSEQQLHLQAMLRLLQEDDTLKLAVRLEPVRSCLTRYLLVVSSLGRASEEQTILLGVDFPHDGSSGCTIGTVLPILSNTQVFIDGDGGFSVTCGMDLRTFKPISVQTMWSLLQVLHKACESAESNNYIPGNSVHSGLIYYQDHRSSPQGCINVWLTTADIVSTHRDATTPEREETEKIIRKKLRDILRESDLENITSKQVRNALEQHTSCALQDYMEFIDNEMIMILAQMDRPSEIFPYLYLGSEWNASNLDELQKNKVTHILNVTKEIDNFFPETFTYLNIRVLDEESTNLLPYWKETHRFISSARQKGTSVLVHCKMGVSRSASTVIAYAMKEYEWTLEEALKHVKERRSIVQPNAGFLRQLQTYQGILDASKQRHSYLWEPSTAPTPSISRYPSPPGSLASLRSDPTRKMNLRFLMRSISEMEISDSAPDPKDKPEERERSVSETTIDQSELYAVSGKNGAMQQLESQSSMDDCSLDRKDSCMDQCESNNIHPDVQQGDLAESSTQEVTTCVALQESTSVDEVFISPSPCSYTPSPTSRRRARRKKKLGSQQAVEHPRTGPTRKSHSVVALEGAGLVSKLLQEVEGGQGGRKNRIMRQSKVGETPEESTSLRDSDS